MKRVLVLGCGGAGKSTLAHALSERVGLPVHSLDALYWDENWALRDPAAWTSGVERLLEGDRWILDGNYSSTLKRRLEFADTVVLLDRGPFTCVSRLIRRRIEFNGRARPGVPEGCVERIDLHFLYYVLTWRWRSRPKVLRLIAAAAPAPAVFHLRNDQDVVEFLAGVSTRG